MAPAPATHPMNSSTPPSAERRLTSLLVLLLLFGPGTGNVNPTEIASCMFGDHSPTLEHSP